MPRAYSLMVGLTEVDETGPYYSRHFPGFDSRRGCEGCRRDVDKMESLGHYLGFDRVTAKHLLNAEATRSRLLGVLEIAADASSPLQPDDLFLLYLSCHGHTLGEGPVKKVGSLVGNNINLFLLHDHPIVNLDLQDALLRIALLKKVRVVTIIDACHAGLGTNLAVEGQNLSAHLVGIANEAFRESAARLAKWFGQPFEVPRPGILDNPGELSRKRSNQVALVLNAQIQLLQKGNARVQRPTPGIAHFGAVRDRGVAQGGERGSLFTDTFVRAFTSGASELTYREFANHLANVMPRRQVPVFEPGDSSMFHNTCFLEMQRILQID